MEIKTIAELGIRLTSEEGSYWNHNGAYQQEGDELYDKLVPAQGAAETLHGELIRGINRLFHEYCNNGNGNAAEITYAGERGWWDVDENEDDYDPNEIIDVQIDPYYGKFLSLIETSLVDRIDDAEVESVLECARPVHVVSAREVWSPEEVKRLRDTIRPAKKECYRTATLLAINTDGEARYVEGQFWAHCFGVDHAFNYVPSKGVFVDFTAEFALGYKPEDEAYIAFKDFTNEQLFEIIEKNGYYGNIYNEVYLRKIQRQRGKK